MNINPMSTARLATHPLHPMLIPFPVAFLVGAFVTALAFIGTGDGFSARTSMWLIGAAIVMALLAAVAAHHRQPSRAVTAEYAMARTRRSNHHRRT